MNPGEYQRMFDAEATHWWYRGLRDFLEARALEACRGSAAPAPTACDALDAGCGTGMNLELLSSLGFRVSGVDASPRALALARSRGPFPLKKASIERLPYGANRFDLVCCMDVVYMLPRPQLDKALAEFHRVLRPGGTLLLHSATLAWLYSTHDVAVGTVERYARRFLHERLVAHGFTVRHATYRHFLLFPLIAGGKLLQKARLGRRAPEAVQGDVKLPHPWVNELLFFILRLENALQRFMPMPIGSSVFLAAQKASTGKPRGIDRPGLHR